MTRKTTPPGQHLLTGFIGLCFLGFLLYANALQAPFIFDDYPNIVTNPHIRACPLTPEGISAITTGETANRPTAIFTLAVNYWLHQYSPAGYHLVNILLHIITAFLVFLLTRQTLVICRVRPSQLAVFAALLWFVNPLHTQSVTYIVQRMNTLAAMFYVLSLFCYSKARWRQITTPAKGRAPLFFLAAAVSGFLGLGAKPIVSTLPLSLLLYEWFFFQNLDPAWLKKNIRWPIIAMAAFLAMVLIFLGSSPATTILSRYETQPFTIGQRLFTEPAVILYYLSLIVFPHPARLHLLYDFPLSGLFYSPKITVLSLSALLALFCGALLLCRRHKLLAFGIFWFLLTLVIESSLIGLAIAYEHRTYLPSVFPVLALVLLVYRQAGPKPFVAILAVMILTGSIWTYRRNRLWTDRTVFWQNNVQKSPALPAAYNNFGLVLRQQGDIRKAIDQFQNALKIAPDHECARLNWALALTDLNQIPAAIQQLQAVLAINPGNTEARLLLARLLLQEVQCHQAIGHLQQILFQNPSHVEAGLTLGTAYNKRGRPDQALPHLFRALAREPQNEKIHIAMGRSYLLKNDLQRASISLHRAIQINPESAPAYNNLANVLARQGKNAQAHLLYQKCLQLSPRYHTARKNLANLCARTNRTNQAIHHFAALIRESPPNPVFLYKLGLLYEKKEDFIQAAKLYQKLFENNPASRPFLPAWMAVMP